MKTTILSLSILSSAFMFSSCSKTPEEAASSVCECYSTSSGLDLISCGKDHMDYAMDFKGDDLTKFNELTQDCALGGIGKGMEDVGEIMEDSEVMEDIKEEVGEQLDEAMDDLEDNMDEALDDLEDEIEESIDEIDQE